MGGDIVEDEAVDGWKCGAILREERFVDIAIAPRNMEALSLDMLIQVK